MNPRSGSCSPLSGFVLAVLAVGSMAWSTPSDALFANGRFESSPAFTGWTLEYATYTNGTYSSPWTTFRPTGHPAPYLRDTSYGAIPNTSLDVEPFEGAYTAVINNQYGDNHATRLSQTDILTSADRTRGCCLVVEWAALLVQPSSLNPHAPEDLPRFSIELTTGSQTVASYSATSADAAAPGSGWTDFGTVSTYPYWYLRSKLSADLNSFPVGTPFTLTLVVTDCGVPGGSHAGMAFLDNVHFEPCHKHGDVTRASSALPDSCHDGIPFGFCETRLDGQKYAIAGGTWTWDHGAQDPMEGWTTFSYTGPNTLFGIANITNYNILDPAPCALSENVVELHDNFLLHPDGQHEMIWSPIIDRQTDIDAIVGYSDAYLTYNRVMAEWDQYSDLPLAHGVFYRPGWSYYPYEGKQEWSPRVGVTTYYYSGSTPSCESHRNVGTDCGLPYYAPKVRFVYEVYASCENFGIVPCLGISNFSPLIDNVQVVNCPGGPIPCVALELGAKFHDGFGQSALGILSSTDPGNAHVAYDLNSSSPGFPSKLADSLVVTGVPPLTSATRWEAKLWFRLKRMGPGQGTNATFVNWRNAVETAKGVDFYSGANPSFAWGYMDSVIAIAPWNYCTMPWVSALTYSYCSYFRDGAIGVRDLCFNWGGGGERANGNKILPDLAFTPGTKVEYFLTTDYLVTPTLYGYLPDTTGGNYYEFEILPSYRVRDGVPKFPCLLYIDASDGRGEPAARYFIERGLNVCMNGLAAGDPIPDPTVWDRYDYTDASSNWNASFYRDAGGNAGATIPQMMGYRLILVNTGDLDAGCMEPRDWQGFQQWLEGAACDGNVNRQGFIANGNSIGEIIGTDYPTFLTRNLGAVASCRSYNEAGCPAGETQNDTNYCTRLEQVPGSFGAGIPTDLWSNWGPGRRSYGVLAANSGVPTAAGNKYYEEIGAPGVTAEYAQVINDRLTAPEQYRTVVDAFSYDMLIQRNPGAAPPLSGNECRYATTAQATTARIGAAARELENAINWTMGTVSPGALAFRVNPCNTTSAPADEDGPAGLVTRLYENRPNPFNPRTAIRFSLAADGPVKVIIYDVNGRRIRTLVDDRRKAGIHSVVWDGADDSGRTVASGIYWSQLQTGDYSSNRKMVVLK